MTDWVRITSPDYDTIYPHLWHDAWLLVGYRGQRSLTKWSLADIPDGAIVDRATLEVYEESYAGSTGVVSVDLVRDDSWQCLTYNCNGSYTLEQLYEWPSESRIASYSDRAIGWIAVDVTSAVRSEAEGDDVLSLKFDFSNWSVIERYPLRGETAARISIVYHLPD